MAVTLEDGRYLVDAALNLKGVKHSDACVARVAELTWGCVFQSGVGTGELRDTLNSLALEGDRVSIARAQEAEAEVATYYAALYPLDEEVLVQATVPALDDQIDPPDPEAPHFDWSMGVFDLCAQDLSQDAAFVANLKELWPAAGGRIIVLSEAAGLAIDGFVGLAPELHDGTYVYVLDRFEPGAAVGVANPHGSVYIPGYGWQA